MSRQTRVTPGKLVCRLAGQAVRKRRYNPSRDDSVPNGLVFVAALALWSTAFYFAY